MTAIITCVKGDGCCRSGIVCVYYGSGHTCSLFICKQTLVQYEEEKKKSQGLEMYLHLKPHPSSSWRLGNMMLAMHSLSIH